MTLRFKPRENFAVTGYWRGEIASIIEILAVPSKDGSRKARPVVRMIMRKVAKDRAFLAAMAKGDELAAAKSLRRVAESIIRPGVKPFNKPSTATRKGTNRAMRRWKVKRGGRWLKSRDRIYKTFRTTPATKSSVAK